MANDGSLLFKSVADALDFPIDQVCITFDFYYIFHNQLNM